MAYSHPLQNNEFMLITSVTRKREPLFGDPSVAREAIETLYRVQQLHPFSLYGFVIMPDHCHFLMYVAWPQTISGIMNSYKSGLTFDTGIRKIWQTGFHIQVPQNLPAALEYIHQNPVKAGLSKTPESYPWSSATGRWPVLAVPAEGHG
jgi:putative transposase